MPMPTRLNVLLMVLALATCAGAVYKWVDEKGVTHYSEAPPPNRASRKLDVPTAPPAPAENVTPGTKSWEQREQEFQQRHRARQEQEDREFQERQLKLAWRDVMQSVPVPGQTRAPVPLQLDVLRGLELATDPGCYKYRITDTVVLEMNLAAKRAVERWTLDACGKQKQFEVTFFSMGPGRGTNATIRDLSK